MARKKTTPLAPNPEAAGAAIELPTGASLDAGTMPDDPAQPDPAGEGATKSYIHAPDPRPEKSISLSPLRGGPRVQLLRSEKFKQMQIRFEGEQPGEEFLAMLADAGWKDRTEIEGVWTKQIDRDARWQSVKKMEDEFKALGNAIRRSRQLAPVLELGN